jgi:hypothetical protein
MMEHLVNLGTMLELLEQSRLIKELLPHLPGGQELTAMTPVLRWPVDLTVKSRTQEYAHTALKRRHAPPSKAVSPGQ